MAVLGLRFCARAFSSCGKRGPLFIAMRGPLTIAASVVVEHRLQTRRLSNCGSRAQPLRGMWDLPRPGLEPVSPALAGRFPTTAPLGKPHRYFFWTSHQVEIVSVLLDLKCKQNVKSYSSGEKLPQRKFPVLSVFSSLGFSKEFTILSQGNKNAVSLRKC